MNRLVPATLLAALLVAPSLSSAQGDYPSKPIRFVVPFAAGSTSDLLARVVGQNVATTLGQPLIVENVAGAGGAIGAQQVARATPDGYTILLGGVSINAANQFLYKKLSYNMKEDFAPISKLGTAALAFLVQPTDPAKTVSEFIVEVKAQPGKLSFASGSASSRVAGEMFKAQAGGLDLVHVPYKGSSQALVDLMGGQVSMAIVDLGTAMPHIQSGKLKALAVTSAVRVPFLPNISTMIEAGLPNYELTGWSAVYAPAKTPKPLLDRLSSAFIKSMNDKDVIAQLQRVGMQANASTPDELGTFTLSETKKWSAAIGAAGIEAQ